MTHLRNRCIVLRARPEGMPRPGDFELVERPVPAPRDGEVVVRNDWLGIAPSARLRMSAGGLYAAGIAIGDVVHGQSVGTVVASRRADLSPGDEVLAIHSGWQAYSTCAGPSVFRVDTARAPAPVWLGVLGSSGQTAWVGLGDVGGLRRGETVVVSAAAGAVGALAGQIARLRGADRVVGVAGGERKCALARDEYGYDACVDRHAPDLPERLASACPEGVDLYFDNTGGVVRDAAWRAMRPFGRVVVCGLIAEYNTGFGPGPEWFTILSKRLTVRGFSLSDHLGCREAFVAEAMAWWRAGRLALREDVAVGLEQAPEAFIRMLGGGNLGKTLVRLH